MEFTPFEPSPPSFCRRAGGTAGVGAEGRLLAGSDWAGRVVGAGDWADAELVSVVSGGRAGGFMSGLCGVIAAVLLTLKDLKVLVSSS